MTRYRTCASCRPVSDQSVPAQTRGGAPTRPSGTVAALRGGIGESRSGKAEMTVEQPGEILDAAPPRRPGRRPARRGPGAPRARVGGDRMVRVGFALLLAGVSVALVGASRAPRAAPHLQIATLRLDQTPSAVAVGAGAVWVSLGGEGLFTTLARVNPKTNRVAKTFTVPQGILGLAAVDGAVWVTNSTSSTVYRVTPASGTIVSSNDL